jgi:hypothetical protein
VALALGPQLWIDWFGTDSEPALAPQSATAATCVPGRPTGGPGSGSGNKPDWVLRP